METSLGTVKLKKKYHPHIDKIGDRIIEVPRYLYQIDLVPFSDPSQVERMGEVTVRNEEIVDLKRSNKDLYIELRKCNLSDEDSIVYVKFFLPLADSPYHKREVLYKRKGIGIAILTQLLDEFRSQKLAAVYMWTLRTNIAMQKLLEKLDFQELKAKYLLEKKYYFKKL